MREVYCRLSPAVFWAGLLACIFGMSNTAIGANVSELSASAVKEACKAQAQKEDMSVGDFGDTEFNKKLNRWVSKLKVQGSGDKFKARCEWDGNTTPKLTVAETGDSIYSRKYSKKDVNKACKEQALSKGLEVGDFGDTDWESNNQRWRSKMMIKDAAGKRKVDCTWTGHSDPVIHT